LSVSLTKPAQQLADQGQALADQLKAKKDVIQQYKQCKTTYDLLDRGYIASQGLITAVVNKVPSGLKKTVQDEGDKFTQTLKDTRDFFAASNCSDA
jgi:ABC-type transporter Mla subunit MlaD